MEEHIYRHYEYRRSKQHASFATSNDYKELIDLALENGDFRWAKELHDKMVLKEKYNELKKSWKNKA